MRDRRFAAAVLLLVTIVGVSCGAFSQGVAEASGQSTVNMVLSYLDSVATYIGKGLVGLLNLIADGRISTDLEEPLGYLGLITGLLFVFAIIQAARKVIWIAIGVGWALLVIRVVLDALKA